MKIILQTFSKREASMATSSPILSPSDCKESTRSFPWFKWRMAIWFPSGLMLSFEKSLNKLHFNMALNFFFGSILKILSSLVITKARSVVWIKLNHIIDKLQGEILTWLRNVVLDLNAIKNTIPFHGDWIWLFYN